MHVCVNNFIVWLSCSQVNTPSGSNNDIPLTSACWKGHCSVVELLLQYNSDIEHHTKDGCTPLMLSARSVCLCACVCVCVCACMCGCVHARLYPHTYTHYS